MVALFASLKWRLLTGRLRSAPTSKRIRTLAGLAVLAVAAVLLAVGIATLRQVPEYALITAAILVATQLVAWVLSPLVAFGVDETVDPHRFALLPLNRSTMLRGLTVAAVIGWLPAVNAILLLGVAVAISPVWSVLPVSVICMVLQLLMCVVFSRAASTSLADLMSTRRGRDLGMLVGFGVFVLYIGLNASLGAVSRSAGFGAGVSTAATVLGWTPPGALVRIPTLIAQGRITEAGLLMVIPLAAIGVGYRWWSVALRKSLESGPSVTESSAPAGDHQFGGAAAGTARVVLARDMLLVWRDPMRRLPWLMVLVFMVGMPFVWVRGHGSLFAVAFGALMSGTQVGNQFGVDGSGMWLHIVAIGDRHRARAEMLGHLLLVLIPGTALVAASVCVVAVIRGDEKWIPAALGACLACLVGAAGIACYMSAHLPYAMPQSRGSMFASSAPQHKARSFQVSMSVLFGGLAVALPGVAFVPLAVLVNPWLGWVGLVVGPAVAGWVAWLLTNKAATIYYETTPEIFAMVRVGDRV